MSRVCGRSSYGSMTEVIDPRLAKLYERASKGDKRARELYQFLKENPKSIELYLKENPQDNPNPPNPVPSGVYVYFEGVRVHPFTDNRRYPSSSPPEGPSQTSTTAEDPKKTPANIDASDDSEPPGSSSETPGSPSETLCLYVPEQEIEATYQGSLGALKKNIQNYKLLYDVLMECAFDEKNNKVYIGVRKKQLEGFWKAIGWLYSLKFRQSPPTIQEYAEKYGLEVWLYGKDHEIKSEFEMKGGKRRMNDEDIEETNWDLGLDKKEKHLKR